jgi:hypothetical protein
MGSRNILAQRHLGKVTVKSEPLVTEVLLGNTHTLFVEFNPRSEVEIEYIMGEWICEETVVTRTGTSNHRADTSKIFVHRDRQAANLKVAKGSHFRQQLSCMMMPSLRPSESGNPAINWRVEVKIVVKGKPDWDTVLDLVVKRG